MWNFQHEDAGMTPRRLFAMNSMEKFRYEEFIVKMNFGWPDN